MQQYGLILTDKGGGGVTYAEDPRPYEAGHNGVNPYQALMDPDNILPPGTAQYLILSQIPMNRIQALPLNYGQPAAAQRGRGTFTPGARMP